MAGEGRFICPKRLRLQMSMMSMMGRKACGSGPNRPPRQQPPESVRWREALIKYSMLKITESDIGMGRAWGGDDRQLERRGPTGSSVVRSKKTLFLFCEKSQNANPEAPPPKPNLGRVCP